MIRVLIGDEPPERRAALRALLQKHGFEVEEAEHGAEVPVRGGEGRQAEKSLRDLAHAVNTAGDVVFLTDRQGLITQVNAQFTAVYGYKPEEVVGKVTPRILKSGRHPLEFYQQAWATLLRGETIHGELCNRASDGRLVEIEETITPFRDDRGELAGFLAVQREIGARKRAEAEAHLLQTIALGVGAAGGLDEALAFVLRQVCATTGWALGEVWLPDGEGARLECHTVWHSAASGLEDFRQVSRNTRFARGEGLPGRAWQTRRPEWVGIVRADGVFPRFEAAARAGLKAALSVPVLAHNEVVMVLNFFLLEPGPEDARRMEVLAAVAAQIGSLIEHKQLEDQLRQSQKMEAIGRLAGGVAHDFNNILAVIMMQTALLQKGQRAQAAMQDGLQQISAAAERAANLTRQLLLFSRRQVLQPRDVDLNQVVAGLTTMLQRIIGEDVRLQLHLHPAPLPTRADAGMLDQVLMNLAVNARDAMPKGGSLSIRTTEQLLDGERARLHPDAAPGRYVGVQVSDTGCGIAPDILPRIFEPFFTTKEPGKGTGLGLATVFGIVKQHYGWIHVDSEPGRGSSFQIYLPAQAAAEATAARRAALQPPRGGAETVLLVEDDPAVRMLVRRTLELSGYRILEASSGADALRAWPGACDRVALLLTDLVMPDGMTGHELAQRLRAERPGLKVIYMSGYSADIAGQELALPSGVIFLPKPFASDELLDAVRRCLDG